MWAAYEPKKDKATSIYALLLYGKRLLFPVFNFSSEQTAKFKEHCLPLPFFLPLILKNDSLHAAQGMADDMDILENALKKKGIVSASQYEYELRSYEYSAANNVRETTEKVPSGRPAITGLVIRRARESDTNELFPLQAGYEKEEVLPRGAEFNPASCRRILESLIAEDLMLVAELEGKLVGKININAASYNRFQIGGNYVLPEYRSRGIARAMTAALLREFYTQKKHFTLFVKKANTPARRVYDSLGFTVIGDYRISYFT
jgi:GNAT superfamily N-acetyltransferase